MDSSLLNTLQFVKEHIDDDTASLLFASHRYKDIDMPWAVEQIESRRRLKNKLPEWYANDALLMSGRVPSEQCSSQQTARYKQTLVAGAQSMCDMTGGMGVDLYYMSEGMQRVVYTERHPSLCDAAEHNFAVLGRKVEIRRGDGRDMPVPDVDVIYLDPARRAGDGSRVYAIEDCEPNVLEWQDELLSHCKTLVVKLSPMVDVTDAIRKMKHVTEVHIVAVKNECKEVLVVAASDADATPAESVKVTCVDFLSSDVIRYSFVKPLCAQTLRSGAHETPIVQNLSKDCYIYDPDVTLMKAQAFASLCSDYSVKQLDHDTHLMASDCLVSDFPGRIFRVETIVPFSSKVLKRLKRDIPQANVAARNFPLTADELRRRVGMRDGGDVYVFGVTACGEKIIIVCKKA